MKKKISSYIRIYEMLSDKKWHDFTDICNAQIGGKEGDKRLREMRLKGWLKFDWRYRPGTHTSQYQITEILPAFWEYYKQFRDMYAKSGQYEFVM